ncbi:hypothetical protein [Streptomyces sp. NPDC051079]|uniref:hypothetical protein n=1 Tax=Streptomyces sp. NPDC051079 TaxID=3155043 RepID=UPI00344C6922
MVLLAADRDLLRQDLGPRAWGRVRAGLGKLGGAESKVRLNLTLTVHAGSAVARLARLAWNHPVAAMAIATAAGIGAYRERLTQGGRQGLGSPPSETEVSEEIKRALALMDTMTVEHVADLGEMLTDHYTQALIGVIDAKAQHRTPAPVAGEEAPTAPVALEASVAKAKETRRESGGPGTVHEMPKPTKKATAKKTTAVKKPAVTTRRRKSA